MWGEGSFFHSWKGGYPIFYNNLDKSPYADLIMYMLPHLSVDVPDETSGMDEVPAVDDGTARALFLLTMDWLISFISSDALIDFTVTVFSFPSKKNIFIIISETYLFC